MQYQKRSQDITSRSFEIAFSQQLLSSGCNIGGITLPGDSEAANGAAKGPRHAESGE